MTLATPENVIALDRAAELISDESRWCRGHYANGLQFTIAGRDWTITDAGRAELEPER